MHKIFYQIAKINREGDTAPEWMLLFAAGWGELADGVKFFVDEKAFALVAALIEKRGNEIHFDYEHASLEKQAAPAAGWIKELVWEDGIGIKARVEWTEKAAGYIAAGEYRYFSPVFFVRKSDKRVCGLHSAALTNTPKTNNLTPILAKLESETFKEESMDREQLIAALGLDENATDAQILAAVAKLGIELPQETVTEVIPEKVTAALDLKPDDGVSEIVASIHALKQSKETGVSREEFEAMKADLAERDATDAVAAAMKAGKITKANRDWALEYAKDDLKGFNTFVDRAPQVVPTDKLPGKKTETKDPVLDEAVQNVAKLMDVDLEDIKKHSG